MGECAAGGVRGFVTTLPDNRRPRICIVKFCAEVKLEHKGIPSFSAFIKRDAHYRPVKTQLAG